MTHPSFSGIRTEGELEEIRLEIFDSALLRRRTLATIYHITNNISHGYLIRKMSFIFI